MKNIKRKLISFISVLLLLAVIIIPSGVVSADSAKPVYVSYGDSIAAGYGLSDKISQGYPYLFAKDRYKIYDYAVSGYDTTDMLKQLASQDGERNSALASASLVTVSIGGNNFLKALTKPMTELMSSGTQTNFLLAIGSLSEYFTKGTDKYVSLIADLDEGLARFEKEIYEIISAIKAKSKAKIVIFTLYNPYKGFTIGEFSNIAADYIGKLNEIINKPSGDYIVCDNYTAFEKTSVQSVNANFSALNFDPHPNKYGSALIARTLANTLGKSINFLDTDKESWAVSYIDSAYEKGYMKGTNIAGRLFSPSAEIKMCDLAVLMARVMNLDVTDGMEINIRMPFTDDSLIPTYAVNSVKACYKAGYYDYIVSTDKKNPYLHPDKPARRIDIIQMLSKIVSTSGYENKKPPFTDLKLVDAKLYPLLTALYENGIFTGNSDGTLNPNGGLKRAQLSKVLITLFERPELLIKR